MIETEYGIRYQNEFNISCCMFRSPNLTQEYWACVDAPIGSATSIPVLKTNYEAMLKSAAQSVGLSLRIVVRAEGDIVEGEHELVSDNEIKRLVNNWNETNVSMKHEFRHRHVTLDMLAQALSAKLYRLYPDFIFDVEVWSGARGAIVQDISNA